MTFTKPHYRIFGAVLLAVAALTLSACGGDDESAAPSPTTPTQTETQAETMEDMDMDSTGDVSTSSAAVDTRATLDRLLGEHALLAQFATQKGFSGQKDFDAIAKALDQNSVEIADVIGSVYGDEARAKFLDGKLQWRQHIGFFVDYTVATAKKDKAGQDKAVGNLKGYIEANSALLAGATELPQGALRDAITEHVTQLKTQLDQYAAGTYPAAYTTLREAYAHMFMTGDALAGGIAAQQGLEGDVDGSAADLRIALGRLLGEHAYLAIVATQKGLSGEKDFDAIAKALDANSIELADAIGSVYGPEAGKKFLDGKLLWRDHVGFFVDYTVATAKKDKAGQDKAVGNLNGYIEAFSGFLATATGLPQEALRESVTEHVTQLKGQVDAYAAGDYTEAYRLTREAYAHMWMTGDVLAEAIVQQSPEKFAE